MREAARVCGYCRTPIATIRCGRCFTMNVPEAHHCMYCGAELGLQPLTVESGAEMNCPRCPTQRLDAFRSEDGTILDCARCGGQFVSVDVLHAMVRHHENVELGSPHRYRASNPIKEPVKYIPCPFCGELMLRRNFGRVSGVVVDVCARHGTWFDVGELAGILAFVGNGGLQRSAALAVEEQKRSITAGAERSASAWPGLRFSDQSAPVTWDDMRDAALAFAKWVRSQLR